MRRLVLVAVACLLVTMPAVAAGQGTRTLAVQGTSFLLDGEPFSYTGVSFFNAIYNPAFNRSPQERLAWLDRFRSHGINGLPVWGQWDNARGFVDACPTCTLYHPDGRLRTVPVERLTEIARDADHREMVVQLALERYRKPVVDDEPARTGRATSAAPPDRTSLTTISSASTTSGQRADT